MRPLTTLWKPEGMTIDKQKELDIHAHKSIVNNKGELVDSGWSQQDLQEWHHYLDFDSIPGLIYNFKPLNKYLYKQYINV